MLDNGGITTRKVKMARSDGKRIQISVYFQRDEHRALKMYCTDKGLTMGKLLHELAVNKLIEEGFYSPVKTLAVIVQDNQEVLRQSVPEGVLEAIAQGQKPDEVDILRIAVALNIPKSELEQILKISFKNGNGKKEGVSNGV